MYKFLAFLLVILFFVGCSSYNNREDIPPSVIGDIDDNISSWYDDKLNSANNDTMLPSDVITLNVNIPTPNDYSCKPYNDLTSFSRPCTLEDINHDIYPEDDYEPVLHVNISTENFGLPTDSMNASFKIKGGYTRRATQKAYSVKLDSKKNLFMKQRKLMLTKSESDRSRLRNKIAFDLFRNIPNISSLKVEFIDLKINGVDYGLFNSVEAIRKEYLLNRGWNKGDHLYDAVNFTFKENSALSLDKNGEPLDAEAFSKILEIKNGEDNSKLLEMLHALNTDKDINAVIAKYFNRKNLLTWLAFNLIVNNKDTIQHNFYLYNPLHSDIFYFLPWDYDGAWSSKEYLGKNEYGISVWWQSLLFKRFFSIKKNRDDIYTMADTLRSKYITDSFIQNKIDKYKEVVCSYQKQAPDNTNDSYSTCLHDAKRLWSSIPDNIQMYKSVIGDPMPFPVSVTYSKPSLNVQWGKSVDFNSSATIVYDLTLSSDVNFSDSSTNIIHQEDIRDLNYTEDNLTLEKGTYYLKVISKELNNPAHNQICYDGAIEINGVLYSGIEIIEVK